MTFETQKSRVTPGYTTAQNLFANNYDNYHNFVI